MATYYGSGTNEVVGVVTSLAYSHQGGSDGNYYRQYPVYLLRITDEDGNELDLDVTLNRRSMSGNNLAFVPKEGERIRLRRAYIAKVNGKYIPDWGWHAPS